MSLSAAACGGGSSDRTGAAGASGGKGGGGATGAAGSTAGGGGAGTSGAAGASAGSGGASAGSGGSSGTAGASGAGGTTTGGGGASGGSAGGATDAGSDATGAGGSGGPKTDAAAGPSFVPQGYTGTPFKALTIPGRINACDYDRGGADVAWCHTPGACASGTVTGDWYPGGSMPYRPPIPTTAKICSGAACNDNVGVCRMNPGKPDVTAPNVHAPADDTYLCYTQTGTWTKYTVVVAEAGTYAVGGFMAVPQGGGANISFSGAGNITTGNLTLAVTNPSMCGGGEYYHCWAQRDNLATVTFAQAGTYLMTLTQTGRFNADNFTFTKM
jgi:hypothetical protein